jgi:hypothetical protein
MGLGTKNRQKQTADICKQHLREKYRDKRGLVEEFILEFEGARKNCDVTRWDRFTDTLAYEELTKRGDRVYIRVSYLTNKDRCQRRQGTNDRG